MAPACTCLTRYRMAQAATLLGPQTLLEKLPFEVGYTNLKICFHVHGVVGMSPADYRENAGLEDRRTSDTLGHASIPSIRFDTLRLTATIRLSRLSHEYNLLILVVWEDPWTSSKRREQLDTAACLLFTRGQRLKLRPRCYLLWRVLERHCSLFAAYKLIALSLSGTLAIQ